MMREYGNNVSHVVEDEKKMEISIDVPSFLFEAQCSNKKY